MYRKRIFLLLFVICALLCIGIGYSTLVDSLEINGTVGMTSEDIRNEQVFNVVFDKMAPDDTPTIKDLKNGTSAGISANCIIIDDNTAVLEISNMSVYGEYVEDNYFVLNSDKFVTGGYDAVVDLTIYVDGALYSDNDANIPFIISWYFTDGVYDEVINKKTTIEYGLEKQLYVKVEMKNVLLTTDKDYSIEIVLDATAVK